MKKILLALILAGQTLITHSQDILPLYPKDSVPNSKPNQLTERIDTAGDGTIRIYRVTHPTLKVYLPPANKANGTAVIICPGGSYRLLAYNLEGESVARVFNEVGVTAFVLKYRLPNDESMIDKSVGPLQDAQRAIQLVREKAKLWQINPKRVGIMGFSAGGHLAGSATLHFDDPKIPNPLGTSLRPDFSILIYPVISFADDIAHKASRENLLGKEPTKEKLRYFSLEVQVSKKTPPVFLMHAKDDPVVKVDNTLRFVAALDKFKIKHDIYLFEKGGHGFGLKNPSSDVNWMEYVEQFMFDLNLILKKR